MPSKSFSGSEQFLLLPNLFARSDVNGRENNEDSFQVFSLLQPSGNLSLTCLTLADGMGGHAFGEHVSEETLRRLALSLFEQICIDPALYSAPEPQSFSISEVQEALQHAIAQVNAHVRRMVATNSWGMAGSTLVAAVVMENAVVVANVGDSPLYHYCAAIDEITQITEDHSVAGVLLKAGMITSEVARVHEGRFQLKMFIGMADLPDEIPIAVVPLAPGDRLLLCSDGVSGPLREGQLCEMVGAAGVPLANIVENLFVAGQQAGETDNQTALLWQHPDTAA